MFVNAVLPNSVVVFCLSIEGQLCLFSVVGLLWLPATAMGWPFLVLGGALPFPAAVKALGCGLLDLVVL